MKHKVCVITGTRAEFGLLLPLIRRLMDAPQMECQVVATGAHLIEAFGNTQAEIERAGIPIHARVPIDLTGDTRADMAAATGEAVTAFARYFAADRPDVAVVLGDRFEIFAAATAAALQGIALAHIHGGETTEGAVDEFLRHAVTKMSYLHFTACEAYRRRVIQLGEAPERVFNVGALGVENIMHLPLMSPEALSENLDFDLIRRPYAIVTLHSTTQGDADSGAQVRALIEAMDAFSEMGFLITKANADAGGRAINAIWEAEAASHANWRVVASLGVSRYLGALKGAAMMLGNSSSGIIEAPALHVPTVNIGIRQQGRMMAESVISCGGSAAEIRRAMQRALSPAFVEVAWNAVSPFGDGDTSRRICDVLVAYLGRRGNGGIRKSFYDIPFEVEHE